MLKVWGHSAVSAAGRAVARSRLGFRTPVVALFAGGGGGAASVARPLRDIKIRWNSSTSATSSLKADEPAARRAKVLDTVRKTVPSRKDAFYVVDLKEVEHKYQQWTSELPRVRPFFAVKCNDDPKIVETLARLGAGFDCASRGEISMALKAGAVPADVIFAHPAKQPSHLQYAKSKGVSRMTFDNEDELRKIASQFPGAEVVLRILADDSHSVVRLGLKFGAPLGEVGHLVDVAQSLNVKLVGVSYHVGSGNGCADSFGAAVADARRAFDIAAARGVRLTLLDIGGGFPGSDIGAESGSDHLGGAPTDAADPYAKHPSFATIASKVRAALDTHFPEGCGVELIAEPGRFFVKSSHALAVAVVGKRRTVDETGTVRWNYYVNDGIYGSFNCIDRDHATCLPSLVLSARDQELTSIADERQAFVDDALVRLDAEGRPLVADALGLGHAQDLADALNPLMQALEQQQHHRTRLHASGGGSSPVRSSGGGHGGGSSVRSVLAHMSASLGGGQQQHASAGYSSLAAAAVHPTTIWGPTCDSIDKITDVAVLPEAHIGDWFVFENMGAYTVAGACKFNGFPVSAKVYLHTDGSVEVQPEAQMED